jgi:hypothetical protein
MLILICADPSPWLCVSDAIKEKNKNKPYDPKKSVWVPNKVGHVYSENKGTASQNFVSEVKSPILLSLCDRGSSD